MEGRPIEADVAVVGAGLAGLVAAREVVRGGSSVVVLEASDRVGGRVLNESIGDGKVVEVGGQWVGPTQRRALSLAKELGVETFPTYAEGRNTIHFRGRRREYSGTIPRLSPAVLVDVALLQRRLGKLTREVDAEAPWDSPRAEELDSESIGSWLERHARTKAAREVFALACSTAWGAHPSEMSLLYLVAYAKAAGSFEAIMDTEGGAQQDRFVGGSQQLPLRLAEELGDRVLVQQPVQRIRHDGSGVRVHARTVDVAAKHAIVAVPPPIAGRIAYEPLLPAARDQLTQRMPMGGIAKCTAVYDEPFWRRDGLTGEGVYDRGPITITFDNSPPDGSPGVLVGFVGGGAIREWSRMGASQRRAAVLDCFAALYGERARAAERYIEKTWTEDPWARGGPVALLPPGVLTRWGPALRDPVGNIHWAGSETATVWTGYMDGAIQSGERAAAEVLAAG
jgi:monoamine oxidase